VGRRDAGADLQPAATGRSSASTPSASRRPAPRRSSSASRAMRLPARVRPARRGDAGHARRADGDARRVRPAEPEGRAGAGHPDGRRLPDRAAAANAIERRRPRSRSGRTRGVFLPHPGRGARGAAAGEIFRQPDLAATLRKLVEAEQQALAAGKSRKEAITPRTTASTRATSPRSSCAARRSRAASSRGGPRPLEGEDRGAGVTSYKGIDVYKLTTGRRARRCCRRSTSSRTST
jgi:hypothetical protein